MTAFFMSFMVIEELRKALVKEANAEDAIYMQRYMKDKFEFLGIKSTPRKAVAKPFLNVIKKEKQINWSFVFECYEQPEREFQYIANDYLHSSQRKLQQEDLNTLRSLIMSKSWWDSVDALASEVGHIIRQYQLKEEMKAWSIDQNLWIRRVSIIHQLKYKKETDQELLSYTICQNLGSKEFFINKAIGWALRTYGDFNPEWVKQFVASHALAPLSQREALRKIT